MGAGALIDGIERADVFDFIAEKIETIGLIRGDGVDVDDAAPNRIMPGRFADSFSIVVECLELLQQAVERLRLALGEL